MDWATHADCSLWPSTWAETTLRGEEEEGGTAAASSLGQGTDGQTQQPPVFTPHTHLQPVSFLPLKSQHLFNAALHVHTHIHTERQHVSTFGRPFHTEWAHRGLDQRQAGWQGRGQRLYRLPHKPPPVFTTSDICCLRLHVWTQQTTQHCWQQDPKSDNWGYFVLSLPIINIMHVWDLCVLHGAAGGFVNIFSSSV